MTTMRVRKCTTDEMAVSNCAILSKNSFDAKGTKHILVQTGPAHHYIFSVKNDSLMKPGDVAFAVPQRKWANLSLDQEVKVLPHSFKSNEYIGSMVLSADFQAKKNVSTEPLNSDLMAREFSMQFSGQAFCKGELLVFRYEDKEKNRCHTLSLVVKSIEGFDASRAVQVAEGNSDARENKPYQLNAGELLPNSAIIFDKEEGSMINLIGKSKGKTAFRSIINPDWDFEQMGIGGLDKEFNGIFRRAFASRVFPPEFIEQLAMKHVRGILLYGPPGTGKTLMARQIGKMLNAREPKIVNGPEVLNKYVGESEANIRKLFADAEEENKRCGANSGLHIIIFDEIDAICKQRGSAAATSSVNDTVINQILSKMDGIQQLNNILVIGMTNRRDMIDEALLRPGRFEVQMEVNLPDEFGRLQIIKIHTARMREYKKLDPAVSLDELAKRTKNFSGAEIEGLVRAAQASAMNRLVKAGGKVQLDSDAIEKLLVNQQDFDYALENDIKPAFGVAEETLEEYLSGGFINWGQEVSNVLDETDVLVESVRDSDKSFVTAVLVGAPRSGKTCLAAHISKKSEFPFVKVVTPNAMVGYSEGSKCQAIKKAFDDAKRSKMSILLLDNLESMMDYTPVGPRFSNYVLQTLETMLNAPPKKDHHLLVLATSKSRSFLNEFGLNKCFDHVIDVPMLTTPEHVINVLSEAAVFSPEELVELADRLVRFCQMSKLAIGIKQLLKFADFVRKCEPGYRVKTFTEKLERHVLDLE